eukprot:TRINITY_DN16443_c0_g1_i1.p1 TRINITY_DN16443_c0_g1~~TRINITY_DN16443_c0_g1_i1.p1  ORF type:complete len:253 (-),score=60.09 TRINITY_DN16443_c0_g1_i1:42-710(-)
MPSFCFLPARRAVLVFCLTRMTLAKVAVTWILINSPQSLALGPMVHLIHNFLPGSTSLNLVIPALTAELVVDTILLMGVWKEYLFCLLPWLIINIMIVLGLGAGVMALLSTVILLPVNLESGTDMDAAFQDIKSFLMVIILNIFLVLQMINVSAVVQIFSEMKKTIARKETDSVEPSIEDVGFTVDEDDASSLDLLGNEDRPKTPDHDMNDSFDSFLYEDVP